MVMSVMLNKNGSFEIKSSKISIIDCYPGIDNQTIRPLSYDIQRGDNYYEITYCLVEGEITLKITEIKDEILLETRIKGFVETPNWINPISGGKLKNIKGYYRQGMGIGGPSGYYDLKSLEDERESINSFGFICLSDDNEFLYITSDKHDKFQNEYNLDYMRSAKKQEEDGEISGEVLTVGFRLEKIHSEKLEIPSLKIYVRENLEKGLIETANIIAKDAGARTHREPAFHWCSWYYYFDKFTHDQLLDCLEGFSKIKQEVPLRYIQIDAGYCTALGDWLEPSAHWPRGIKAAIDDIKAYGYKPGIWIGPYMVGNRSKLFHEHPDWILTDLKGNPIVQYKAYGEVRLWSYPDEEYYTLDTSHPEALKYIISVFETLREWGVEFFKTDFMFWGIHDSTEVKRYTTGKTSVEYFRDFMKAIREVIGEESYWLACIAPYLPFLGYADGMRVAIDVTPEWRESENAGTGNMIRQLVGDNYLNNIYWQNDSDVMMIRDFHTNLSAKEVDALTLLQAVSGAFVCTSDLLHRISPERLDLFKFVIPDYKVKAVLPYLGKDKKEIVFVHNLTEGRYILFFFNPTKEEIIRRYRVNELIDKEEVYLKHWNSGENTTNMEKNIIVDIPSHGCSLYFATSENALEGEITNLWRW